MNVSEAFIHPNPRNHDADAHDVVIGA